MKTIVEQVREAVAADPSLVPHLLQAVNTGVQEFVEREAAKRNALAYNAIVALLAGSSLKKSADVYLLVDVAYHQFPDGFKKDKASPVLEKFWKVFLNECAAELSEQFFDWLKTAKGPEYEYWFGVHVEPAVNAVLAGR